ncbi:MAG: PDZ domain-containing protein [Isosphaeraceae bacterium]
MISLVRGGGRFPSTALAWALGIWVFSSFSAMAGDDGSDAMGYKVHTHDLGQHKQSDWCMGTLGYGPPGLHSGYYGFGLSFHRGYGYGGSALGVGAEGGYPYYGGPGYPHTWPTLNRFCGIVPFPYYGGPEVGYANLSPVNSFGPGYPNDGGFGSFTGAPPYPESFFAPYTAAAATTGSASGTAPFDPFRSTQDIPPETRFVPPGIVPPAPSTPGTPIPLAPPGGYGPGAVRPVNPPAPPTPPAGGPTTFHPPGEPARSSTPAGNLGFEQEAVVQADGSRALKITSLVPETIAANAGLHSGDIILSINGYRTEQAGNLTWIMNHAVSNNALMMNVINAKDGKEHTVTLRLPLLEALNTARPSYLPVVGYGPLPATR